MNEARWLKAKNPMHLLMHVRRNGPGLRKQLGRRKFRLFGVACSRRIIPTNGLNAIAAAILRAEEFADGLASIEHLAESRRSLLHLLNVREQPYLWSVSFHITHVETWEAVKVWHWTVHPGFDEVRGNKPKDEKAIQAEYVRCIFGNPFRPVTFDPIWRSATVVALAEAIYADRAFDRLPFLADAMEEASCDHPDVLAHCRRPGPHARGCWVVDLILGKQ